MNACWLGIDLGTQSVRVVALSDTGRMLAHAAQPLPSYRNGPRHEQDPEQWWRAVVAACRAVARELGAAEIRGLAVDGTSGTFLLVDRSGRPLMPALMYDDTRAQQEMRMVREHCSFPYQVQPSWALPKLLWLVTNQPGILNQGRLAHQTDFITGRLAGHEVPSDSSNALKTGYDLAAECWPRELFAALRIPDGILPRVVRPGTQIAALCPEAAELAGIPAGTPIISGMTDGCAAQIAADALQPGNWNSVLGTTLVLKGATFSPLRDPAGIVYSHRSPDGTWFPGAASSAGAGVLTRHFGARDLAALDARAATHEPSSVIAYPLAGRGERFPFCVPDAEAFMLGSPADEIDLYAALLQGVALVERLCFDYLTLLGAPLNGQLAFTGGATRSRYWCQLRADILGRAVRLPENAEPAVGMAILAASHGSSLTDTARHMVKIRETVEPRRGNFARFGDSYLALVAELLRRGWISRALADQAVAQVPASD